MPYYAHIRQDENGETIYQTVAEHLTGTAALCREFAADFGAEADGDLMGLAHDLGKCTDAFQKRLLEGGPVVDHTTAGMLTCIRMKRPSAAACGADRVELYTEAYAREYTDDPQRAVAPYLAAAEEARRQGLGLNAGHDLSLENLRWFAERIPWTDEVSIGHALICDALYYGLENTVQLYRRELKF